MKKNSPAENHLNEIADRHNEHVEMLLLVRKKLANSKDFSMDGTGVYGNSYLPLPKILRLVEPLLIEHGFVSSVYESTNVQDDQMNRVRFTMRLHYVPTNEEVYSDPITIPMDKVSAHGKVASLTYARRCLYECMFNLPRKDDDAKDTMNVADHQDAIKSHQEQIEKIQRKANKNGANLKVDKPKIKTTTWE